MNRTVFQQEEASRNPDTEPRGNGAPAAFGLRISDFGFRISTRLFVAALTLGLRSLAADAVDESKLPPPSTARVDFLRDIQPIFADRCVKCHGSQKPKSGFRLDSREMVLKGGENGVAVIPGQSAKSPLIHYVARLVPEMGMPPEGKGDPLSTEQIALLRAWIDQGVAWGGVAPPRTVVDASPTVRWISIDGNERKFREVEWMREGIDGGVESFLIQQQISPERRVKVEGSALRDNYRVTLSLEESDRLFLRAGFEQFRKWYGDEGGFYRPFTPQVAVLDRDLFLDWGRAWVEAGGTLPSGMQVLAGYEFQFKDGDKSMTQWLPSTQTLSSGDVTRSVLPTSKAIDEQVHVLRMDALMEWSKFRLEERFRFESYDLTTRHTSVLDAFPSTLFVQRVREENEFKNLANAFSMQASPEEWMLFSVGYLYRHMDGTADFEQRPVDATGAPGFGLFWNARGIPLEQSAHVVNANAQLGPWESLTATAGVQAEWNQQESFGRVSLDEGDASLVMTNPASIQGDYDRFTLQESAGVRFTAIPFTLLYGEARWQQESINQFEYLASDGTPGISDFLRDTDATYEWQQYRAGFNVSPWSRVSLNAYYQYRNRDDSFDHVRDERGAIGGNSYPGFITARLTEANEAAVRLVLRPLSWLKTTLSYRVVATDFRTETQSTSAPDATPGGWHLAGNSDAHIYSANATLTPWRRLYLFTTFEFQDTRTVAADNFSQSIAPFRGNIYSVMASTAYVLSEPTDLHLAYDFSHADYTQPNEEFGLPLGIDYQRHAIRAGLTHRFWKNFLARAEYAWFWYEEPSSGGFGDYVGHGVFATLNMRWQ
jgi:mono/diheme cytochrome c family protein